MAAVQPIAGCGEFTNRTNRERCGAHCLPHPTELCYCNKQLEKVGCYRQLYGLLQCSSLDMSQSGYDHVTGCGLLQADRALQLLQ